MGDEWIRAVADDLGEPMDEHLMDRVLNLAALVAHATERRNAPLATFLAGRYVADAAARGVTVESALVAFRRRVQGHLPEDAR